MVFKTDYCLLQVKSISESSKESILQNLRLIKLPVVFKTFVMSFFEWPFYTGFTVIKYQFSYFLSETYVMGTQKNRVNQTVHLSIQTYI